MATNSVTLAVSLPSKADRQVGYSFSAYCSYSSGTPPKASSNILSASLYLNAINVYTSCNLDFGSYGIMPLSSQSGDASYSGSLSGFDATSIRNLAISGGSMSGTITKSGSYSGNALNFRSTAGSLTIYYEDNNASTGTLDKTTVAQSGQITVTINKSDSSYQHYAIWKNANGQSVTQNVGSGTSSTFTIPANWPTGSATCTIQTVTASGDFVGNYVLSFSVHLDTSVIIPATGGFSVSLIQSPYVPSAWNAYVKGLSKAQLSVPNAAAGNGASFQSIDFTCGAQMHSSASDKTWTTDEITETGTLACDVTITNNYGNTAEGTTQEITVYDYGDPQFTTVIAFRCLQNGAASDSGAYISVRADISFASVGGKNSLATFAVQYKKSTASSWSTAVTISSGSTIVIGGNLSDGTYQVRIVAIDQIQNLKGTYTERIETVMTSDYTIHCLDGGYNVSIGMQGNIPMALQLNPNWKFYHGTKEVKLDDAVIDTFPASGSSNAVASGGTYDMIISERCSTIYVQLKLASWEGSGPFTYVYTDSGISENVSVQAAPSDEESAKNMSAGILITPQKGSILFSTSAIPNGDINLTIIFQPTKGNAYPFFVSKKGGGGEYGDVAKFEIVEGVFSNIADMPNMLINTGNKITAIFEASFDTKTIASGGNIHALNVPEDYRPYVAQSFNGRRWDAGNTESTLPITIGTDGAVKIVNNSSSAISFKKMQFFESWIRKQARMIAEFYKESGSGPSDLVFNVNQIDADTVNNKVTYKLDALYSTYNSGPAGNFTFGIRLPEGFGPLVSTDIIATFRLSDGTTKTAKYFYLSRNATYLSLFMSSTSVGFSFELTTDLYQENANKFTSFNRTNVSISTNWVEINPDTGKIRFQLAATFDATTAANYSYGTEIGFGVIEYKFRPKTLPGEYFNGIATKSNGEQIAVQCSLRGSSSSYACSLYVKSLDTGVAYGTQITGITIDYTCDAYGY